MISSQNILFMLNGKEEKQRYFNPAIQKKVLVLLEELFESNKVKVGS